MKALEATDADIDARAGAEEQPMRTSMQLMPPKQEMRCVTRNTTLDACASEEHASVRSGRGAPSGQGATLCGRGAPYER